MSSYFRWVGIFLGILMITVAIFAAGFYYQKYLLIGYTSNLLGNSSNITGVNASALFTSQTATFEGKITAVNGTILAVENNQGVSGNLPLSEKFLITKALPISQGGMSTPSADIKVIDLDRVVNLALVMENGEYHVVSIQYNKPPNSL